MISIEQHLDIFESGRPSMRKNNTDLLKLGVLAEAEFHEFTDAWLDLLSNPSQETAQEASQEAADVALFLAQCMRSIGTSLDTEMRDKIAFNTSRFASVDFPEDKPYLDGYMSSKQWVKDVGWKQQYYMQPNVTYDLSNVA